MGREEWKTNSFPDIPAAYTKTREDDDMSFPSIFSSNTYPEVTVLICNYHTWNTGWSTDSIENQHCQRIDNLHNATKVAETQQSFAKVLEKKIHMSKKKKL